MTGFIGLTGINKRQRAASINNGGTFHCAAPSYRIKPPLAGPRALAGTFGNIDGTLPQGMTPRAYVAPEENPDHEKSLASKDPKLAANKRLVYDMWRTLLDAQQVEEAPKYLHKNYIQHNPLAATGLDGFMGFFRKIAKPKPLQPKLAGFIEIIAEGDKVVLATLKKYDDAKAKPYSTTWFDMWTVKDGLLTEHWDTQRMMARPAK